MNCWDILGIEPTRNRADIEAAFERQRKFAEGDELKRLEQAFLEATGDAPVSRARSAPRASMHAEPQERSRQQQEPEPQDSGRREERMLSAAEQQVVREVIIQVRAMLNDPVRVGDVAVWRAIVTEPPADQRPLRQAIAEGLETDVRPLAENGALPDPVVRFLADWFEWYGVVPDSGTTESGYGGYHQPASESQTGDDVQEESAAGEQPQLTNFVPHVIGWVIGLVVLYSLFSSLVGGG